MTKKWMAQVNTSRVTWGDKPKLPKASQTIFMILNFIMRTKNHSKVMISILKQVKHKF